MQKKRRGHRLRDNSIDYKSERGDKIGYMPLSPSNLASPLPRTRKSRDTACCYNKLDVKTGVTVHGRVVRRVISFNLKHEKNINRTYEYEFDVVLGIIFSLR